MPREDRATARTFASLPERTHLDRTHALVPEDLARLRRDLPRRDRPRRAQARRRLNRDDRKGRAPERAGRGERAQIRGDPRAAAGVEPADGEGARARRASMVRGIA